MKSYMKMEFRLVLLVFCLSPITVHSHGNMMLPTTWFDAGGKIGMRNQLICSGVFAPCNWFTNFTFIPGKPTLDPSLWTYSKMFSPIISNEIPQLKHYSSNHPWGSPGSARIHSPCGVLGGNPDGCPANANNCPGGDFG